MDIFTLGRRDPCALYALEFITFGQDETFTLYCDEFVVAHHISHAEHSGCAIFRDRCGRPRCGISHERCIESDRRFLPFGTIFARLWRLLGVECFLFLLFFGLVLAVWVFGFWGFALKRLRLRMSSPHSAAAPLVDCFFAVFVTFLRTGSNPTICSATGYWPQAPLSRRALPTERD